MTLLALIRHGATAWNEQGIVQGRNDVPLSANGRDEVSKWTIPPKLKNYGQQFLGAGVKILAPGKI